MNETARKGRMREKREQRRVKECSLRFSVCELRLFGDGIEAIN